MRTIFIISIIFLSSSAAYPCQCSGVTFTEELADSDKIFVGTPIKRDTFQYRIYYLFSIQQVFKGEAVDTITIGTGFGGGDCGAYFQIGTSYLIYANSNKTNRCRRNGVATNNFDILKLKYIFDRSFIKDIGQTNDPKLTPSEAEYFNSEFYNYRSTFFFDQKNVAFFNIDTLISKQTYFEKWGGKELKNRLIILTEKEKNKVSGYDAIIVTTKKKKISPAFRKRLIRGLN